MDKKAVLESRRKNDLGSRGGIEGRFKGRGFERWGPELWVLKGQGGMRLVQSTPALKLSSYSCALLIHNNGFHHLHLWRDLASLSSWHMAGLAHACMHACLKTPVWTDIHRALTKTLKLLGSIPSDPVRILKLCKAAGRFYACPKPWLHNCLSECTFYVDFLKFIHACSRI